MDLLDCTVMPYAWGSRTTIAELTGRPSPTTAPEAEMWMGAHPLAPSKSARGSLADVIALDPERELGARTVSAFGPRLPFLLKVLAAAEPLSIQAHPNMEQARAGFEEEERRGIARDAGHRNYKDASHKPELLCALTPFDALCGFRAVDETVALFAELSVAALDDALSPLRERGDVRETFRRIMSTPEAARAAMVDAVAAACARPSGFVREKQWATRLSSLYPGDVGVVSALLLNLVHLEPGDAVYLDAGNLHAYLEGTGVEIMASSDNVLRGGLTKKHVDVPELMKVLDFGTGPVTPLRPRPLDGIESVYETPAKEFRLSILEVGAAVERITQGPEILLVIRGSAQLEAKGGRMQTASRGHAVFVPASIATYTLTGPATVYRATTNL